MIRRILLSVLLCALALPVYAEDLRHIDKVYTKQTRQTWGQWFNSFFGLGDFNKSYAVVIGVSQFDNFQNLATVNDPVRMKNYLLNEAGFDYVRLITGRQVNLNKIRSIMVDEVPRMLGGNDRFLFYWSGHGATDRRNGGEFGYLPVSNSRSDAFSTMLSMNDLSQWDRRLNVKQALYLLDACFSGLAGDWFQVKNDGRKQTLKQIARPSRQILTAGLANEQTYVIPRLGGSVFTAALLDGLRGQADTETPSFSRDGIVSARELELYVKRRVAAEMTQSGMHNRSLTPLLTQKREGDFFFFTEDTAKVAPLAPVQRQPQEVGVVAQSAIPTQQQQSVRAGRKIIRLPNNLNLIEIPAGRFRMGSDNGLDNEKPVHAVIIPRPFLMSETEITFSQYDAYASVTSKPKPDDERWGRGSRPVINVSWNDAQGYTKWLSQNNSQGLQCRLPSEAEWEYAARAGTTTEYPWGNTASHEFANYGKDQCCSGLAQGRDRWVNTAPVGQFPANAYGLQDMHGNVDEWVQDCWHDNYQGAPVNGSAWVSGQCGVRVFRGGSWIFASESLRSAFRGLSDPHYRGFLIGFRIVCSPPFVH